MVMGCLTHLVTLDCIIIDDQTQVTKKILGIDLNKMLFYIFIIQCKKKNKRANKKVS